MPTEEQERASHIPSLQPSGPPTLSADHIRITLRNNNFEESGPFRADDGSFRISAGFQVYTATTTGLLTIRYEPGLSALGRDPDYLLQIHDNWVSAYREVLDINHFDTALELSDPAISDPTLPLPLPIITVLSYLGPPSDLLTIAPLERRGRRSRSELFSVFYPAGISKAERRAIYTQAYVAFKRERRSLVRAASPSEFDLAIAQERAERARRRLTQRATDLSKADQDAIARGATPPSALRPSDRVMLIHGHSRFRGERGYIVSISPTNKQVIVKLDIGLTMSVRTSSLHLLPPVPAQEEETD